MNEFSQQSQDSLAARLKAGDRAAAAELVDIYYERIYLFMRRLGHSRQVSEDLTQESFFQAWQHIGRLRSGKALNSWLYQIAANISRLHWRRHKGQKAVNIDGMDVPDSSKAELDKVGHLEQLEKLKNGVANLPMNLKETVVLHYMQHLTIAEAAEAIGVREGTFKSRLSRALRALRKQIVAEDR
ncbi:MAG: RNA polymerase sigma factor [Planctomycetota bacterium]|nr:MAG: RNA polymerase sigma factor [Planctomycetota bacterium]